MVILGLERPVEYGSRQIFDPTMANMVLNAQNRYVQAMREDYLQGREDLKEFNKNFGDFFSPIQKDMEWYDQNVTGATRDLINNLYAQGMDMRNPEFRAAVSKFINNMPVGKINQLKQSAAAANEYLKNKGTLEAAGKFNQDFEDFVNGGMSLSNWDTALNGMWTRTAPAEIKSLKELTESSYNNRTPHDLTKDEVLSFQGQTYDPRMRYKGFTDADLLNIANTIAPGLTGTPWFDYYRDLAKRQVAASGKELTADNINAQLARNIANTQQEYLIKPIGDLSDWYQQQNLNINREKLNIARKKAAAQEEDRKNKLKGWTYRQQLKVALQKERSGGIRETFDTWSKGHKGGRGLSSGEKSLISQYYKSTQEIPTAGDQRTAKAFFAGLEQAEKQGLANPDLSRVSMEFNDNTLNFTKIRQYAHANKNMTKGSLSVRFNNFLKRNHIKGFSTAGEVSVNWTPVGDTDFYELNGTVSVKREDLDNFFLNVKGKGESVTDEEKLVRMAELGLTLRDHNGKIISKDGTKSKDIKYGAIEYIDIPTTRTISAEAEDNRMIDTMDDIINVGKAVGAKREPTYTYDYDEE